MFLAHFSSVCFSNNFLFHQCFFAVDDVESLCRCFYLSALKVIYNCSSTVLSFHIFNVACDFVSAECECECLCLQYILVLPIGICDVVLLDVEGVCAGSGDWGLGDKAYFVGWQLVSVLVIGRSYYEFFADYRISLQAMPLETLSPEEFVDNVVKYYDELSTYCFLKRVGDISGQLLEYQESVKQQMLAVAEACSKDKNYFEKAMIYSVDEPNFEEANVRKNVDSHNEKLRIFLEGIVEIIEADKSGKYNGLKQNKNWKETITGIKNVIPLGKASTAWLLQNEHTEDGQRTLDLLNCICPNFDVFTARDIDSVKKLCEKYDIELWW